MGKLSLLLISLSVILFFGISSQLKSRSSQKTDGEIISEVNIAEFEQDTLLEWMTYLKDESRRYRNLGDLTQTHIFLTRCIEERWREPSSAVEHEKLGWVYVSRGYYYDHDQGDFLAAKKDYLAALEHFKFCEPDAYHVGRFVYEPLGNIHTRLGENELAFSMLDAFKRVSEENNETQALMNAYNDIGRAFVNIDRLDTAITLFAKGISLDDSDDFSLSLLLSSKAEAEEMNGEFENSSKSAKKCIYHVNKLLNSIDSEDFRYNAAQHHEIDALKTNAKILAHEGYLKEAHEIHNEVLALTSESYPKKHREMVRALVQLGNSYNALDKKVKAIECYQLGLCTMFDDLNEQQFDRNPSKSELFADVVLGEALVQKGRIAHEIFRETDKYSWLNVSVQAYLAYFEWVDIHRGEQFEFNSKLGSAKDAHSTGEFAMAAFFDMYSLTNDKKWTDSAFVLMDQTKAIVLAEERGFKELASKNPEMYLLLKEQNALKLLRSQFKSSISSVEKVNNSKELYLLKKRLSELDQQSQLLDQKIRSLFPAYRTQASSKLEGKIVKQLKNKLTARKASILSYFVGDKWVYLISGSPGKFEFERFAREDLMNQTASFFAELNEPNTSTPKLYSEAGKSLFDLLVGDKSKKLGSNWVIFPDGILNSLPFEALVSDNSKGVKSFRKMEYLLRDHVIHYAPSAFFFAHENLNEEAKESFLGIAPVFKNSKSYDFLPKSKEELESGTSVFSGEELTEGKATKKQFFKRAEQYDILHISTHAGTNSGKNNDAWMAFSDDKSDDHRLIATELLKLDLPASLVVLNACETGSGTVFKGEGPMSLARGFLDAGSQSTVTNLWSVNHESNAVIMQSFYESLSKTQSPSRSLSQAKRDYLSNGEIDEASAHPYYWSSAILVGTDASVIAPSSNSNWIWIILGSSLVLILGASVYRRRKKARKAA